MNKEKFLVATQYKEKVSRLEAKIKLLTDENDKLVTRTLGNEKQNKLLLEERDKLKQRITRLAQRKGKFDSDLKTCKNCTKEFSEKENFNWSCRTHQSEWGGEMWWCCGKTTKDFPGCKFRKHESKDDEEEGDRTNEEREEELAKLKRY